MFKKILFFVILAGIGFGIYTGIHKIFEVLSTPKTVITTGTTIAIPTTGSDISGTISLSGNTTEYLTKTKEEPTQTPGWFSRTWTSIKAWFSSKGENTQEDDITLTGDSVLEPTLSGEIYTGDVLTGNGSTGTFFEEIVSTGTEVEEVVGTVIIDTGVITPTSTTTTPVVSKPVATKTPTVKKPSTTTTTTTSTSGKDPILDALFK